MKGVVFNLLESFIVERFGHAALEAVLEQCEFSTQEPFVGPGTYADRDLFVFAGTAARHTGLPLEVAVKEFGRYCFPKLLAMVGAAGRYRDSKTLLCELDSVVHVEVHKLMRDARTPKFIAIDSGLNTLTLEYQSPRKMCAFLEGLLVGMGEHFQQEIRFTHVQCTQRGSQSCKLELEFAGAMRAAS